ncbi:MAG: serine/threonine protein kinase [Planctomycetota bacterium]
MAGIIDFLFGREKPYGGLELIEEIAKGGMSRVYKARDPEDGRIYAVKVLAPESAESMERFKEVFETEEGEIALQLDHPNVVKTYEYGRTGKDAYYIVMEYIDGPNLETLVATRDARVVQNRFELVLQTGRGLTYIHDQGLIHRDFCPKNVLYGRDDVAKIIDFGLCVPVALKRRTQGHRAGTASYMAPEQVRGRHLDERADIYAYGMSAFEILTQERPLPWAGRRTRRMQDHLNIEPKDLTDVDPELPGELEEVIKKCVAKDRNMRYKSMHEVMKDMQAAVEIALSRSG